MQEQVQEFLMLQGEIEALRGRGEHDTRARKKLKNLDMMMKSGGQSRADRLSDQADKVGQCLRQLSDQITQLAGSDATKQAAPSNENRTIKKFNRAFV